MINNLPASEGDSRDSGSIPGSRRFPGGGNGHPLMFSSGKSHGKSSLAVPGVPKSGGD